MPTSTLPRPGLGMHAAAADERLVTLARNGDHAAFDELAERHSTRLRESREFLAAVDHALGQLPLDYRTAVTLRDVEGLSTADAAQVLGIGERALKSRVHRGRMALRAKLDDYFASGYA